MIFQITVLLVTACVAISGTEIQTQPFVPHYPYEIDSMDHQFDGFIERKAEPGSRVKIENPKETGKDYNFDYLRLRIMQVNLTGSILHQNHSHPSYGGISPDEDSLKFVTMDTSIFGVSNEGYIIVERSLKHTESREVEFFVVLTKFGTIVSNPVPFRVTIEDLDEDGPHGAAIYAGVLVLLIVFFALLIPTVVRAKRRYKVGKPMFQPGSARPSIAVEKIDIKGFSAESRNSTVLNLTGYENEAMSLDDDMKLQKNKFGSELVRMDSKAPRLVPGRRDERKPSSAASSPRRSKISIISTDSSSSGNNNSPKLIGNGRPMSSETRKTSKTSMTSFENCVAATGNGYLANDKARKLSSTSQSCAEGARTAKNSTIIKIGQSAPQTETGF